MKLKARKRGSDKPFEEVSVVQLKDGYVLYSVEDMEFEHDTLSTEIKTYSQISEEQHWQSVRERAAIAAMQGLLSNPALIDAGYDYRVSVEQLAIGYADTIVERLKNNK